MELLRGGFWLPTRTSNRNHWPAFIGWASRLAVPRSSPFIRIMIIMLNSICGPHLQGLSETVQAV